jgi:hypothetical protein
MRIVLCCAACCLSLLAASCGSSAPGPESGPPSGLLPPPLSLPVRETEWAGGYVPPTLGEDQGYPGNRIGNPDGDAITFTSFALDPDTLANLAFSIFRTEVSGPSVELLFEWQIEPPAGLFFIGLGNRDSDRWDWYELPAGGQPLTIANTAPYVDDEGDCLLALVQQGTPDGMLTRSELNAIRLRSVPEAGWKFHKAGELDIENLQFQRIFRLTSHDGRPLILVELIDGSEAEWHLFYSSTAAGADGDWARLELLPEAAGPKAVGVVSAGGALHVAAFVEADQTFRHLSSPVPGQPWAETMQVATLPQWPNHILLGTVAGGPAAAFHTESSGPGSDEHVGYAYPDGEDWVIATAVNTGFQGNLGKIVQPFEVGGRPLLVHEQGSEGPNGSGLYYAWASDATPESEADWDVQQLAPVSMDDFRLGLAGDTLAGQPYVAVTHTQFTPTPAIHLFHLPGSDPAPANWDTAQVDYFDYSQVQDHGFAIIDSRPVLLNVNLLSSSPSTYGLDIFTGGVAVPAVEADWTVAQASSDAGAATAVLGDVGGSPAVAMVQVLERADGTDSVKLIYGILSD